MEASENTVDLRENSGVSQKIQVHEIDIRKIVEKLLESLSAKQKLVLTSRFGIGNEKKKTLEAIGKKLNITRERVRQIETDAISEIRKYSNQNSLKDLQESIISIVREKGEICATDELVQEIFHRHFRKERYQDEEAGILEIAFLVAGLKRIKSNREIDESWVSADFNKKNFTEAVSYLEEIFDERKNIQSPEAILAKVHYSDFQKKHPGVTPEHVLSYLNVSKKFGKNIFGDWGKARWPLIRPRGVREKATLVLMKKKVPLHFRQICRLIEEYGLSKKKVHPQTVHNELIRDKRFVLVGRGTYALRAWGFQEGTVREVITDILKSAGGPMRKSDILKEVLKKRKVKKATIFVNLADKRIFEKTKKGYKLKA